MMTSYSSVMKMRCSLSVPLHCMMGLLENYVDFFGFYSNDDDDFVLFSDEDEVQSLCAAALHDGIARKLC